MKEVETERFILRKVDIKDAEEIFSILSNERVVENLNMEIHKNIEDTKKMIEDYLLELKNGNKYPFSIIEKNSNQFVGVFLIKLDLYDEDCYEFTIYLKPAFWNKGIYTETLKSMIKYTFEEVKTGNFRGFAMEKNIASSRVLEKCNFKLEKIFKVEGIDGMIKSYLMTKEEYKEKIKNKKGGNYG